MKSVESVAKPTDQEIEVAETFGEELPIGICVIQNGKFCYVNSYFGLVIGYAKNDLIGNYALKLVFPEDRETVKENTTRMLEDGLLSPYQFRVIAKDGGIIWLVATVKSIVYHGRPATLGNCMEITGRKQIEEALKESEDKYRELADSITDVFFTMDEHLRCTYWNRSSQILTGIPMADAIGKSVQELFPDSPYRRKAEQIYRNVLKMQQPRTFVSDYDIDGRYYIFETNVCPSQSGISVFVRDITERKQAEEKLRQSEENYRALFDNTATGMFVLDVQAMKVIIANQAAAEMIELKSAQEAIGMNPFDSIPPWDRGRVIDTITKEVFEQDLRRTYEFQATTRNGKKIWLSIRGAMVAYQGRQVALISFTDITEQKLQDERLMMTDRLASLGELASGAAHELNNPLTSIIGFSQLLMERDVPEEIRDDLKLIYTEALRASHVTKDLLTFAGKHTPVKEPCQINAIIEDVLRLRTYEHRANCIEVERRFDPNLPKITVDYFQMQQVFLNVIINAEYFMVTAHGRGTLTITTKRQNDTVMILFTDDGPGIPPENLRRIFDPFFTTKEAGKGTGLGLSICHGIVTEHGGQIYARSRLGQGATIVVELPVRGRRRYSR